MAAVVCCNRIACSCALRSVATYAGIFDANSTVGRLILALGELISLAGLIWIISLYLPIIMPRKK